MSLYQRGTLAELKLIGRDLYADIRRRGVILPDGEVTIREGAAAKATSLPDESDKPEPVGPENRLRHPRFAGIRSDKDARDVVQERKPPGGKVCRD